MQDPQLPDGIAPDGSPVAVYLELPPEPEFTPLLEHLAPGASVLDLGCGVGRLANLLVERGHEVTGVDASDEMLRHLHPDVTPVHATLEGLRLDERFDAVVLASHLVNTPDPADRRAFLETAAANVADRGLVYIEHWDPASRNDLTDRDAQVGPVAVALRIHERSGDTFRATVTYRLPDRSWEHPFEAVILDQRALDDTVHAVGLQRSTQLSPTWFVATPVGSSPVAGHPAAPVTPRASRYRSRSARWS